MRTRLLLCVLVPLVCCGCYVRPASRRSGSELDTGRRIPYAQEMKTSASKAGGARRMLDKNGFVVLGRAESWEITEPYLDQLRPVFITSDAVLYVFHCLFRDGLSEYEKRRLLPELRRMTKAALAAAISEHRQLAGDALLGEPSRRNVVLFSVAQALLDGTAPSVESTESGDLVAKISEASGFGNYPAEDFTQYLPRGAYAKDPELSRYFRGMKWLSRVMLPVVLGRNDREPAASIKLRQAYLLGRLCERPEIRGDWQHLYDEISSFAAAPDSITPPDFYSVARRFGDKLDDEWMRKVREEYAKPQYSASAICPVLQGNPGDAPAKYVQLMGERYIPDGEIHQQTTFPYVPDRVIPSGLDIGYALFDSTRADLHLSDQYRQHLSLRPVLQRLHERFAKYEGDAKHPTLYAEWVAALRATVHPEVSAHVPAFFGSDAWQDKALTTVLAAWTYMRHDFVLYAKQPVIPASAGREVMVEPVPEAYGRLAAMAEGLGEREFAGMADLGQLCRALEAFSRAQIAGRDPWEALSKLPVPQENWGFYLPSFGQWLLAHFSAHVSPEHPAVVVDVATDTLTHKVLHAATGPLNLIVARGPGMNGKTQEYMGLVLSYYEFTRDDMQRLTDTQWERMALWGGRHRRYRPSWAQSYMYKP